MYEDRPEKDTPQYVLDELAEYGGRSPNGQPIWRLVLAQNCRIHCFGPRNQLPEGLKLSELSDDPHAKVSVVPTRIELGEFWIPRYKHRGWILERWFPASAWGTRERWEAEKASDQRTRLLASFPHRGAYMMMPCGPWKSIAEVGDLKGAIRCYNVQQRKNPVNWGNYLVSMAAQEERDRQVAADSYADEISAQHRDTLAGMLRTVSLDAQKFRNVVAKHTAGGVNLGASEKWGS